MTTNDIGPPYENNDLGIGGSIISKVLIGSSGINAAALKKLFNKHGDPGDVAFEAKVNQRTLVMNNPTPLSKSLLTFVLLNFHSKYLICLDKLHSNQKRLHNPN